MMGWTTRELRTIPKITFFSLWKTYFCCRGTESRCVREEHLKQTSEFWRCIIFALPAVSLENWSDLSGHIFIRSFMKCIEFSAQGFNDTEFNLRTILAYVFRQLFAACRGPRRHDSCVCPRECVFKLIETCINSNGSEHTTATPGPKAFWNNTGRCIEWAIRFWSVQFGQCLS